MDTTEAFTEFLAEALWSASDESGTDLTTRTYSEAGVPSGNDGLVVRLADGTEFQVTVVRSR